MTNKEKDCKSMAYKHFWPEFNGQCKPGYCLHHKDKNLYFKDNTRYHEWRIEDLVPMTMAEHTRMHASSRTDECKQKLREIMLGKRHSEETRRKISVSTKLALSKLDLSMSDETKKKLSIARTGKHYPNLSKAKMGHTVDLNTKMKISEKLKRNKNVKGRKHMHKDGKHIMAKPEQVEYLLENGWSFGTK